MKCIDCSYWYSDDLNESPFCHYPYNDEEAPCEREERDAETEDIDKEPWTVVVVSEDNHGLIQIAADRAAAIDYLISSNWITGYNELWFPERQDSACLKDIYFDWEDWVRNRATDDDFENMGFFLKETEVYVK